ncbi:nuclease-related domain-containing protein [Bacillus sp. ISL-46]|uniref:nuclease-related domain-containing protein n=1 Tax=Bacillus sp. ISL-46 TaxID=2819129 RepID=UPI001BE817D7|nr:nuclease-related domain-containing protein [Bacillus sp. ISL-46]MBT2719878.1 NERD domain-containing protein [Bacillus sp. ISL-46]
MIIKHRQERSEIIILRSLNVRMSLSDKEVTNYLNLKKGYEGEKKSDVWLEGLSEDWLIIHDLLLEYNNSKFQIDTLLISQDTIYPLDVKNYEGDHYVEGDKWYISAKKDGKNPLHQLSRCETLLRSLLRDLRYHYPLESYLIFINPEFHLYQTSINPSIVFPTQLNRFLKKLNTKPAKLNKRHFKLAEQLVALHLIDLPYPRLPAYAYGQLEKGTLCPKCYSFFSDLKGTKLVCGNCGCTEGVESAVLRSVTELMLLFPDRKITTKAIFEWCKIIKSEKTIRRILARNFKYIGHGKSANYVFSND